MGAHCFSWNILVCFPDPTQTTESLRMNRIVTWGPSSMQQGPTQLQSVYLRRTPGTPWPEILGELPQKPMSIRYGPRKRYCYVELPVGAFEELRAAPPPGLFVGLATRRAANGKAPSQDREASPRERRSTAKEVVPVDDRTSPADDDEECLVLPSEPPLRMNRRPHLRGKTRTRPAHAARPSSLPRRRRAQEAALAASTVIPVGEPERHVRGGRRPSREAVNANAIRQRTGEPQLARTVMVPRGQGLIQVQLGDGTLMWVQPVPQVQDGGRAFRNRGRRGGGREAAVSKSC
ncbi:hypothetical protein PAPYR_10756 [Paratrimastix pyriformis]|uniref:Uncharacterized protein n=1 Tax=Paratrimastix pyriformis TaxID=342808 RepID=A0ABQ8UCH6_9EUKA|nr:hypothetical protein PAPYR_10756 [Paratrimastix pyriformis]